MIVSRGMGILAPIVFVLVYLIVFGLLYFILSPHFLHGWFVYVGSIIAGLATWKFGSSLNAQVYQAQRSNPGQDIHTHSLYFLPMEIWAIPFTVIALFFGYYNTTQINQKEARAQAQIERQKAKFEAKITFMENVIKQPQKGDYISMSFIGENRGRSNRKERLYHLPLKVVDFNEQQIQLFCPFDDPYQPDLRIYGKDKMYDIMTNPPEDGFTAWINKLDLLKTITKEQNATDLASNVISPLLAKVPLSMSNVWRLDGPEFSIHTSKWRPHLVKLEIKNSGLPFSIQAVQFKGNKAEWRRYEYNSNNLFPKQGYDSNTIRMNEIFVIHSNVTNTTVPQHIEVFCLSENGNKFRFDVKMEEGKISIRRSRI